ncbi:MAG: hypothetical protein IJ745_00465 [Bacteroidales bacterium]|nr:hypothetical protein [Bacteroidales bacterium]
MAKQDQGIIGGFRGTIGPVIGYQWRGRWCLRARPQRVSNPRTEAQQEHRRLFREMVQTASRLNGALRHGLRQASLEMGMTEGNLFVKMNKDCFRPQGIDYEALELSAGPVAPVAFGPARIDAQGVMHVEFEKNPLRLASSATDEVHVVLYCPAQQRLLQAAPVHRKSKRLSISLPDEWLGMEIHAYGFVTDHRQWASATTYIPIEASAARPAADSGAAASALTAATEASLSSTPATVHTADIKTTKRDHYEEESHPDGLRADGGGGLRPAMG